MAICEVIHVRDMRAGDVYIGRRNNRRNLPESIWHNPFVIGKDGAREEVLAKFEVYLQGPAGTAGPAPRAQGQAAGLLV